MHCCTTLLTNYFWMFFKTRMLLNSSTYRTYSTVPWICGNNRKFLLFPKRNFHRKKRERKKVSKFFFFFLLIVLSASLQFRVDHWSCQTCSWGVKFYIVVALPLSNLRPPTKAPAVSQYSSASIFTQQSLCFSVSFQFCRRLNMLCFFCEEARKLRKMMSDYGTLVWSSAKFLFLSLWFAGCWVRLKWRNHFQVSGSWKRKVRIIGSRWWFLIIWCSARCC